MIIEQSELFSSLDFLVIGTIWIVLIGSFYFIWRSYSSYKEKWQRFVMIAYIFVGFSLIVIFSQYGIAAILAGFAGMGFGFYLFMQRKRFFSNTNDKDTNISEKENQHNNNQYNKYFFNGKYLYSQQKYKKAAQAFVEALYWNKSAVEPWYYIGLINKEQNRITEAIQAFREVLNRDNEHQAAKEELNQLQTKTKT